MPEMLETIATADHKDLVADYGEGKLTIRVPGSIPWWKFAGAEMQRLFAKMIPAAPAKRNVKIAGPTEAQASFESMSVEDQLQFAAELMIALGTWDLTKGGKPVPLNAETFAVIGAQSPATVLGLLTQFAQFLPELMTGTMGRAEAARKSGNGNLPVLSHGRRHRKSGRHAPAAGGA